MATYYVRTDGNNSNTGTGPATTQAWQTIGKVFASGSVVTGGDIVYIAPGTYTESISVLATSPTSEVQIIGNPTASQFGGVNAGVVKLSAYNAAGTAVVNNNTYLITATSKNYYAFSNIVFESAHTNTISAVGFYTSRYIKFDKCIFRTENIPGITQGSQLEISASTSQRLDAQITNCYFGPSNAYAIFILGQSQTSDTTKVENCYFDGGGSERLLVYSITASITNCTFVNTSSMGISQSGGSANAFLTIKNCLFKRCTTAISGTSSVSGAQTYNRFVSCTNTVTNIPASGTSTSTGVFGVDSFESLLFGLNNLQPFTSYADSPNKSFGNATGAPATDLYGVTWTGTSPDAGSGTYRVITSNPTNIQYNGGVERNASAITIAPGSTSQSIELYLGATGLTYATSGLAAYYVRNQSAPVAITLVTQTPTGAWSSGGFAEIDSSAVPGVYRLDVPNAAFSAGASDVTIVVRGASGTNGAVLTVKLSSGGLTAAQTASAVWGASVAGYVAETDFGGVVNATRNVVGGIETSVQDIPQTVWDEPKANHTIPNTFGDYLDTKVSTGADTSRIQLRQGPFLIKQNATEGLITEVNQFLSTVPNMEIVLIDSSGGAVSVAGSTLVLRVRNQAGTAVVNNVTPTVAYADGGVIRWTPNLSWNALSVTTPGTYRIIVERTMGTTTTTFGPFLVQLSSG
jgi:hypothetical protein